LSFAKQVPTAKSSLDVNAILETALKLCQPQMRAAGVQCSTRMADRLSRVHGDSNQMLQVFSHIISNAIHAMSARGGILAITTAENGGQVGVEFADNGPGMAEPDRVFDPFYTTRPVGQGTGLGLSACYGIIQEHGGKISCRNSDEGGAVFLIELPVWQHAPVNTEHAQVPVAK
jgi:signal transduction histidine kinase